jgi:DNA-binding FadR family transcriptional regulator
LSTITAPIQGRAASGVARDLCKKIVQGTLSEGQLLPESELMTQYKVSRAVLREALRLLEWDSFVTIRRGFGGGAVVTLPDVRVPARYCGLLLQTRGTTLEDVDRALKVLEPELVSLLAASSGRSTEILEVALRASERSMDNASAFILAGSHFHELLPTALGNQPLTVLLGIIREIRGRHNLLALTHSVDEGANHRRTLATHRAVLTLINDGAADEAASLWLRHMNATSKALARSSAKTVLDLFSAGAADFDLTSASSGVQRRTRIPKGSDIIAADLRRRIISGEMAEGESVPTEAALMEQFGLSRPSVREALRILEAEHLVQLIRGSHHGGRARLPNIDTAVWQTGLLLQRSGSKVGELIAAQRVLERCVSRGVTPERLPALVEPLKGLASSTVAPGDAVTDVLERLRTYDVLSEATENETLRCLTAIGRALVAQCVAAQGLPAGHGADGAGARSEEPIDALVRRVHQGDRDGVIRAWQDDSERFYQWLGTRVDPGQGIDMFH